MPSQDKSFNDKLKFIEQATQKLDSTFTSLAEELLKAIIEHFADKLERDGNTIKNTPANLQLIASIENIYNNFSSLNLPAVASQILSGTDKISSYNVDYFGDFDSSERDFKNSVEQTQKIIRDRLGVSGESGKVKLVKGGYMDSLLQDNTVKNELKNLSYREVMKQTGFQDFKKGLETFIVGDEEKLGGFRQFYRNYAYDIFVEVDRSESTLLAVDLDLQYFVYEGDLIASSREFCVERAGKVFSIKEAEQWINDPWIKKNFEKGYITSYTATQDMGLFACRHLPRFISKEVAKVKRPDIK